MHSPAIGKLCGVLALLALLVNGCRTPEPGVPQSAVASTPVIAKAPVTTNAPAPAPAHSSAPVNLPALFDGKTLKGWEITDFAGHGPVVVTNGEIHVGLGHMTGINLVHTNGLPRTNYEISLEAKRTDGGDFFCGLTFPVGKEHCSFIVGGWGGGVVGLSSIDSEDASQNETTTYMNFANNKWFRIRVRVEPDRIQAWIDDDRVANVELDQKRIGIRIEMESSTPIGLATWNTAAAWRNIQLKKL